MEWNIVFYADAAGEVPASTFLDTCPLKITATFSAVLDAVRAALILLVRGRRCRAWFRASSASERLVELD